MENTDKERVLNVPEDISELPLEQQNQLQESLCDIEYSLNTFSVDDFVDIIGNSFLEKHEKEILLENSEKILDKFIEYQKSTKGELASLKKLNHFILKRVPLYLFMTGLALFLKVSIPIYILCIVILAFAIRDEKKFYEQSYQKALFNSLKIIEDGYGLPERKYIEVMKKNPCLFFSKEATVIFNLARMQLSAILSYLQIKYSQNNSYE